MMLRKNQVEVAFQVDFDLCKAWHKVLRKNQVEVAFQVDFDPCKSKVRRVDDRGCNG